MTHSIRTGILTIALVALTAVAVVAQPNVCIVDEDIIDNGAKAIEELAAENVCGGGVPANCVNDGIADPGVRVPLPIPVGTYIGTGHPAGTDEELWSGQISDYGMYKLGNWPASWDNAGPTPFGDFNYLLAEADGFGNNGEHLLDEIDGEACGTADLQAMIGETCCWIVYDSDISWDGVKKEMNLQGATLGILAAKMIAVGPDPPGDVLPDITIQVQDPTQCQILVALEEKKWTEVKRIYKD